MEKEIKRIGILTSGGDCCGLNAVIASVVRSASKEGIEVLGFKYGYDGLYKNDYVILDNEKINGIASQGGSILCNSNKTNLFNHRIVNEDGSVIYRDDSMVAKKHLDEDKIDALVIVGGDGSMTSARDFKRMGVNIVCIPKTIDNDVPYTDQTFGYSTAVGVIANSLQAVRTTGYSHDRVMIIEAMGRHAGWLALEGGLAGEADIIIIPEIEYDINHIKDKLVERYKQGYCSTVICVSEGAKPKDGEIVSYSNSAFPDSVKLGGIGQKMAYELEQMLKGITDQEVKNTNIAYTQRGGQTNNFDIVLSFRYGAFAIEQVINHNFGKMVALRGEELVTVALEDVVGNGPTGETSKGGSKNVTEDCGLLKCARSMGVYFGE